jgi:hypothetical protein
MYSAALRGDLSAYGYRRPISLIEHTVGTAQGQAVYQNTRVLMYSDGEHNVSRSIENPFRSDAVLLTAFFGKAESPGAAQMRALACTCPLHRKAGFFPIFDYTKYNSTLRGLFRMASGHSGFCLNCLDQATKSLATAGAA